jgi:hypothetical protein
MSMLWKRNEDLFGCPADDLGRGSIQCAAEETADKRDNVDQVHRTPAAGLRD